MPRARRRPRFEPTTTESGWKGPFFAMFSTFHFCGLKRRFSFVILSCAFHLQRRAELPGRIAPTKALKGTLEYE